MISGAIIACDISKYTKAKLGYDSVGTMTGIINGAGSFGGVFGQLILGGLEAKVGWDGVFYFCAGFTITAALPASVYVVFEYRQWKKKSVEVEAKRRLTDLHRLHS